MTQLQDWTAWEEAGLGTVENPPASNRTRFGEEYGWNGVAWCSIYQSLATLHTFDSQVLWTASVADAMARAQQGENGMQWLPAHADIEEGFLVTYDFGPIHGRRGQPADYHIEGIVNRGTQAKFQTIGGNVSNAVREQWRDRKYVTGFIRLPFASEEDDPLADYGPVLMHMTGAIDDLTKTVAAIATELERMAPIVRGDGDPKTADSLRDLVTAIDTELHEVRRNLRAADVALGIVPETKPGTEVDLKKVVPVADQVKAALAK